MKPNIAKASLRVSRKVATRMLARKGWKMEGPDDLRLEQAQRRLETGGPSYEIQGTRLQKNQVVEWLCRVLVDEDRDLVTICRDEPGCPPLSLVMRWRRENSVFDEALTEAEKVRAMVLVSEATETARNARNAPSMTQVVGAKLAVEALQWEASKLNTKFADKQIIDAKVEITNQPEDALRQRLKMALLASPEMLRSMAPQIKEVLGAEALEEVERAVLSSRQEGSVEAEVLPL
jgi:hypothetical protein